MLHTTGKQIFSKIRSVSTIISLRTVQSIPVIRSQSFTTTHFCQFSKLETVKIRFFEESNDNVVEVDAELGKKVLDIALENNIDIEGACGGELACSTCHVVVSKELFDKLPKKKEEEEDMLDLAWGLTDTSRLCCQIIVTKDLANTEFKIPKETNNMLK